VSRLCALYGVSRSGYYARIKRGQSHRSEQDRDLTLKIRSICHEHKGRYGSRRVHQELIRMGLAIGRRRVERLMRAAQLRGRAARIYRPKAKVKQIHAQHLNLLWHQRAVAVNEVWVADVTYIRAGTRWSYLAIIMDQWSRRLLGWRLARTRGTWLTRAVFQDAFMDRRPDQLIFHSDRGAEYTSSGFGDHLAALGVLQSTTRGGAPEDNPHAESFFHSLKAEMIHGVRFDSERSLRNALEEYVPYYNCKRLHSSLGYRPPAEFEAQVDHK
jgi:putative transposase